MKTVLMLAESFLPRASSATKRSACLAKYLPSYDWRPIVICREWTPDDFLDGMSGAYDPDFVRNIPESVVTIPVPWDRGPKRGSWKWLSDRVRAFLLPHRADTSFSRNALRCIEAAANGRSIDAIWATYPNLAPFYLADFFARRWRRPWIADFRDIYGEVPRVRSLAAQPLHLFHEGRLLRSASATVAVTEGLASRLHRRHGVSAEIIPNGFDPEDMAPSGPCAIARFSIVYTGGLNYQRVPLKPVLDALDVLVRSGRVDPRDVDIETYGWGDHALLKEGVKTHALRRLVKVGPALPRADCIRRQRSAAVLLQNTFPQQNGIMTGKIFEYLAAGRPILAYPGDRDCVDNLLQSTHGGVSCSTVPELAACLDKWHQEWKQTHTIQTGANAEALQQYSRRRQAKRLADLLDLIAAGGDPSRPPPAPSPSGWQTRRADSEQ